MNNNNQKNEQMRTAFEAEDNEPLEIDNQIRDEEQNPQISMGDSDLIEDEFTDEETDSQPRRNYVTEIPEDELEFERREKTTEGKSNVKKTIALTSITVVVIFCIALFFILRGKNKPETAVVKDNSLKVGVNSNASVQPTDFQTDLANRYGEANTSQGANSNTFTTNEFGTVGNSLTAPPPNLSNNGIFQPGATQPLPPPPIPPNNGGSNGSLTNGGGNGATSVRNSVPPETTRIIPDNNTEVVELPKNQERNSTGNNGGGRNDQVSLFFYEKGEDLADGGRIQKIDVERRSATARPGFGTVLPIRIMGRLHTLGTGGLARMELTRAVQGAWGVLPRGTMFVGRVAGGEGKRLFVSLLGYIDSESLRLVTLGGDLQGTDGALGVEGEVKQVGSRWSRVFGDLFTSAKEIGSSYLLGRRGGNGTVINNGQVSRIPDALGGNNSARFVLVPAGSEGYIVINDLPPSAESDERLAVNKQNLTDDEILKLIQTQSPGDIERVIPSLSPKGQQIARGLLDKKFQ